MLQNVYLQAAASAAEFQNSMARCLDAAMCLDAWMLYLFEYSNPAGLEAWMPGCLDIWYLGGFMWFCLHLGGFRWISWIPGAESLSTCGGVSRRAAAPLTNLCSAAGVGRLVDSKAERDPGLVQPLTKTCGPY